MIMIKYKIKNIRNFAILQIVHYVLFLFLYIYILFFSVNWMNVFFCGSNLSVSTTTEIHI